MIENGLSDGGYETPEQVAKAEVKILRLISEAKAKGGTFDGDTVTL